MVVLLVSDDVHVGIEVELGKTPFRRPEVLGDIDGSTVGAQQELAVETVSREVAPHRTVGILYEYPHVESLLYEGLP